MTTCLMSSLIMLFKPWYYQFSAIPRTHTPSFAHLTLSHPLRSYILGFKTSQKRLGIVGRLDLVDVVGKCNAILRQTPNNLFRLLCLFFQFYLNNFGPLILCAPHNSIHFAHHTSKDCSLSTLCSPSLSAQCPVISRRSSTTLNTTLIEQPHHNHFQDEVSSLVTALLLSKLLQHMTDRYVFPGSCPDHHCWVRVLTPGPIIHFELVQLHKM